MCDFLNRENPVCAKKKPQKQTGINELVNYTTEHELYSIAYSINKTLKSSLKISRGLIFSCIDVHWFSSDCYSHTRYDFYFQDD